MKLNDYKQMVSDYYLFNYQWKGELELITTKTNTQFLTLNKDKNILKIIDVDVVYPYFKIINLFVFILSLNDFANYNSYNPEHCNLMINYVAENINKKKIRKYNIKIIENDNIFTIYDSKYNILKLEDNIESDKEYLQIDINIRSLINNILEQKT